MNQPKYIILHTVAKKGVTTLAEIDTWHRQRGWKGIGYHYYIRKDGTLEFGREETEVGAHCTDMGMNSQSIGICLEGHGNYEHWTIDQLLTLRVACIHLMDKYDIPVTNILGHRETGANKDCPGKLIDMATIRREVEQYKDLTNGNMKPISNDILM